MTDPVGPPAQRSGPGRPEHPIIGYGPVHQFARALRQLRDESGGRTVRALANAGKASATSIFNAHHGKRLPTAEMLRAYLRALDLSDEQLAAWESKRATAVQAERRLAERLRVDLTGAPLVDLLAELVDSQQLDVEEIERRISESAGREGQRFVGCAPPVPGEVAATLRDRSAPLTERTLRWTVFACGGRTSDIRYWMERFTEVVPDVSADLVVRSEQSRWRHVLTRRFLVTALGTAMVATTVVAGALIVLRLRSSGPAVPGAVLRGCGERAVLEEAPDTTIRFQLLSLARRAASSPVDPPRTGPYGHVTSLLQSYDTTAPGAIPQPRAVQHVELWRHPRTGHTIKITRSTEADGTLVEDRDEFAPGEYRPLVERLSTNLAEVRAQLAEQQQVRLGPAAALVRGVGTLNDDSVLGRVDRCLVLEALAEAPDLEYQGHLTDCGDRPGIAFSSRTADNTLRDTLIFDQHTGVLLCHQLSRVGSPDGEPPVPALLSQTRYVSAEWTIAPR